MSAGGMQAVYGIINQPGINRQLLVNQSRTRQVVYDNPKVHRRRIQRELRGAGLTYLALTSGESAYLPLIIHPEEHIGGAVYGRSEAGMVMLVATDRRVFYIDKKPLFTTEDQINYDVVAGVSLGHAGFGSTVTLHTRVKDFKLKTHNHKAATKFVQYIEMRALEHLNRERKNDKAD